MNWLPSHVYIAACPTPRAATNAVTLMQILPQSNVDHPAAPSGERPEPAVAHALAGECCFRQCEIILSFVRIWGCRSVICPSVTIIASRSQSAAQCCVAEPVGPGHLQNPAHQIVDVLDARGIRSPTVSDVDTAQ